MAVCGDGVRETPEQCDDGNNNNGDYCSNQCTLNAFAPNTSNTYSTLGTNLAPFSFLSTGKPFIDLMRARSYWASTSGGVPDNQNVDVDNQGWVRSLQPNQAAYTIVMDINPRAPAPQHVGDIVVLYEGEGQIDYVGDITNLQRGTGRDTMTLTTPRLSLSITSVNPGNYLRNIRVIAPGGTCIDSFTWASDAGSCPGVFTPHEQSYLTQPYHPSFLYELRPFKVLRFMDWMDTNRLLIVPDNQENPLYVNYQDYPDMNNWYAGAPVPLAMMTLLCNTIHADCYFDIPHSANDAFVTSFAQDAHAMLDPTLKMYIEYSNELWNYQFDQVNWVAGEGCRRLSSDPDGECLRPGDATHCQAGANWDSYAQNCLVTYLPLYQSVRSAEIMTIFENVIGQNYSQRLVRVMGNHVGTLPFVGNVLLGGGRDQHIDVVANAPYFGGEGYASYPNVNSALNVTSTDSHTNIPYPQPGMGVVPAGTYEVLADPGNQYGGVINYIRADQFWLDNNYPNVRMIAYEGGSHYLADVTQCTYPGGVNGYLQDRAANPGLSDPGCDQFLQENQVLWDLWRDPRMAAVYSQYLTLWDQITGDGMFIHFTSAHSPEYNGTFSHLEYQGQPRSDSPKYDALLNFVESKAP